MTSTHDIAVTTVKLTDLCLENAYAGLLNKSVYVEENAVALAFAIGCYYGKTHSCFAVTYEEVETLRRTIRSGGDYYAHLRRIIAPDGDTDV